MIDLIPDEDQQALLDSVTTFLRCEVDVGKTRSEALWAPIAALGWLGLTRSEDVGGAGLGIPEEMLLLRECGRFLVTPSLMATLMAVRIADSTGETALATALANGSRRAALSIRKDEETLFVIDGSRAEFIVTIEDDFVTLRKPPQPGHPAISNDNGIELSLVPNCEPLTVVSESLHARLLIAAQLTGIAEAVRDLTTEYAKVREQFGQSIGAFQAVKHGCSNLAIHAEAALSQTTYAALCLAGDALDARTEVAAAVQIAGNAATTGAESAIQLYGAMGFTEECTAHLYLKRAHLLSLFTGRGAWQLKALIDQ